MYVHLCMTHIQTDIFTNMGTNTFIFTSAQAHVRHSCAHAYIKHTLFYNTWLHKLTYMHTCTQEAGSLPPSWLVDVKLCSTEATSAGVARHPCGPCHKA